MKPSRILPVLFCSAAFSLAAFVPSAQAQIVNGGFETGTSTTAPPWTFVDPSNFTGFGSDAAFANSGSRYAFLGASPTSGNPSGIGTLSQTFNTIVGVVYQISFFLANDGGTPPNSFVAMFNGISFFTLAPNSPGFGYTQFGGLVTATGASSTLSFQYRNDADFFRLDDVTVNRANAVPDSSLGWLALPTLGLLCFVHYRGRKAGAAAA